MFTFSIKRRIQEVAIKITNILQKQEDENQQIRYILIKGEMCAVAKGA